MHLTYQVTISLTRLKIRYEVHSEDSESVKCMDILEQNVTVTAHFHENCEHTVTGLIGDINGLVEQGKEVYQFKA